MSTGGGGGGGKRSVNVELNLVPYIDLLSTLICFLLLTAVWQQISVLSTNAENAAASDVAPPTPPDPNRVNFSVSVYLDRVEAKAGEKITAIPHLRGDPDLAGLLRTLQSWKTQWPDRKDVTLNTDNKAPYKHMISVMDTLAEGDFADVGVNTQ